MADSANRPGILFITQGHRDHASSRVRCLQYFPYLLRSGYRCTWIPRIPVKRRTLAGKYLLFPVLKRVNRVRLILGLVFLPCQVLFIQRIFLPEWLMKTARWRKRRIIYDFDDAIYFSATDPKADFRTRKMIEYAGRVIVSSPVLKEYATAFHPRVDLITSPVALLPCQRTDKNQDQCVIGWMGSEWTGKYLNMLSEVFEQLKENYAVHFLFVGCPAGVIPAIHPEIVPWSAGSEGELLARMDIGIMPLPDTAFEQGKGGYKLLQYMAAGKPVVASPVGINTRIVEESVNGFLCRDAGEWYRALEKLVTDVPLRRKMGTAGYRMVKEKYSLEVCYQQISLVLDDILNNDSNTAIQQRQGTQD